jgi:hypothetical protein
VSVVFIVSSPHELIENGKIILTGPRLDARVEELAEGLWQGMMNSALLAQQTAFLAAYFPGESS